MAKVIHIDENGKVKSGIRNVGEWCWSHKITAGMIIAGVTAGGIFIYKMVTSDTAAEIVTDTVEQVADVVSDAVQV